ncbi:MAG: ComEC/Rec2 family competence protein [Propionibacteriaceae bacterium]|nr:ComEC/Rec2 family competence protein [Propionibacteriaceae bacterium]
MDAQKSDLRLVIPALTTWLGMWLITGWRWGLVICIGVCVVCVLILITIRRAGMARLQLFVALIAVMITTCWIVGGLRVYSMHHNPLAQAAENRSIAEVQVVIQNSRPSLRWDIAVINALCTQGTIAGQASRFRTPVILLVPSDYSEQWLSYPAGSVLSLRARLAPSELGDNSAAVLTVISEAQLIRGPPAWQRIIESMRAGVSQAMSGNTDEQAGLVPGLVVGDVSGMPHELMDDFRTTGLTHLTAVSGANLVILLSFLSMIARTIGIRGRWLTVISVLGVAVFVALCHLEASVLRAAAMGSISLAGVGRGARGGSGLSGLSLAVIVLCWIDPWMSRSFAFVLSVLACGGIMVWGRTWSDLLGRWLPRWVAEAMAIPLAAQIATQPVICWLSGAISIAGVCANAAAGPWVAPATVFGFIAALVSPLSPRAASWAGYVAGWCAQPILTTSHFLAGLPGASHPWPVTTAGLIMVVMLCVTAGWIMPSVLSRAWVVLTATAVMVAMLAVPPFQPGWPAQQWSVVACDVGQGDALVVRTGNGQAILFDTGPPGGAVVNCLRQLRIYEIPVVVISHAHADHDGSVREVLDSFAVGAVLVPEHGFHQAAAIAEPQGVPVLVGKAGMTTAIGDARVQIVSTWNASEVREAGEESSTDNDESLIVRVDTPELSVLVTGDVELTGQQTALLDSSLLKVDVLKVPHHGSARQVPQFLQATGARIALVSVGSDNVYRHPAQKTLTELTSAGMTVVRTDEHGSIAVSHQDQWRITTQK